MRVQLSIILLYLKQAIFKITCGGGLFQKINWNQTFENIARFLSVKKDELLLNELYKLWTKYNNIKKNSSRHKMNEGHNVVLCSESFNENVNINNNDNIEEPLKGEE